jgi:hypothetical protein
MAHLWEVEHPYYCSDSNYFDSNCHAEYKTLAMFLEEHGAADLDMNLVFRWDWREGEDWGAGEYTGDDYYRNGRLELFYVGQRKGLFRSVSVEVCRRDEPAVLAFLEPRFQHLLSMWRPIPAESNAHSPSEASASAAPRDEQENLFKTDHGLGEREKR